MAKPGVPGTPDVGGDAFGVAMDEVCIEGVGIWVVTIGVEVIGDVMIGDCMPMSMELFIRWFVAKAFMLPKCSDETWLGTWVMG